MADSQLNNTQAVDNLDFDKGFAETYRQAETDAALDWADSVSEPAPTPAPAAMPMPTPAPDMAKPKEGLGVGEDIGLGVISAPRSVVRGATKGINSMVDVLNEIGDLGPTISTLTAEGERSWIPRMVTNGTFKERLNKEREKQGQPPIDWDADLLPVPDAPAVPTVTGNIIESVSQFLTGFKGVDKLVKGGGVAMNIGKGAAADMLAFDQHEQRLSNVVQQVPELANPVAEYLQAKEDDGFWEGKLKQGIEGLGLGAAGEALVKGVKFIKRGKVAAEELKADGKTVDNIFDLPAEEAAGVGVKPKDFNFLGDMTNEGLLILQKEADNRIFAGERVSIAEAQTRGISKPQGLPRAAPDIDDYKINFVRIQGPEEIKKLMDDMVNNPDLRDSIERRRRGKIDQRTTLKAASDIDGFDSLISRRVGDAFNAEYIVAARKVYYDTTEKLMEAAELAASPKASEIDQFNFRKMVAIHHAVQKEFMGVRAEAGRALAAWKIPVGGSGENARAMSEMLQQFGGEGASKQLAQRVAALKNNMNTTQLNAVVQKASGARTMEAMAEAWTLGLLTNPTTHVVNLTSNVLTGLTLGAERVASSFMKNSPVDIREGVAFFSAYLDTQKLAFKNAAQAFRTGEVGMGMGKIDLPMKRATSRELLDPNGKAGWLSKAVDGYGYALNRYVGGMLAAGDEYSKTLLYQSQMRALATREGVSLGLKDDALKTHVAQALENPSEFMRADATTFANYGTFTKELGKHGQALQRFLADYPAARLVAPFIRTPANIFKFTFERTPLGYMSGKIREDIAAGGYRAATAQTRIAMGTGIMAMASDMAMNGKITGQGPTDPQTRAALRRTGWQPYSVKVGDTYYSYARMEPLATVLGMGADMSEILSNYEAYDIDQQQSVDQLAVAAGIAVSNQIVGKTFMTGFADLTEVLADPKRNFENWKNRFAGSFVPAAVAGIERALSPETSQVFSMMDGIKARIPGLSADVPPRRNVWGEPIKAFYPTEEGILASAPERLLSLFNPVYYSAEKDSPVDAWMLKNGFSIDMPDKVQEFDGARVDMRQFPKAYDRLVELRGGALPLTKYGNQSMREFFYNLATEQDPFGRHVGFFMALGNNFDDQQNFIRKVVSDYTKEARTRVLEEFPEIREAVQAERNNQLRKNDVRQPLLQGGTP